MPSQPSPGRRRESAGQLQEHKTLRPPGLSEVDYREDFDAPGHDNRYGENLAVVVVTPRGHCGWATPPLGHSTTVQTDVLAVYYTTMAKPPKIAWSM